MVDKTTPAGFWPSLHDPFRLLSDPLRALGARIADWVAPASEASSDAGAYRIAMELPGVAEGDIELTLAEGLLTVRGEKRAEREEKGDTWYFCERQFGSFARSFRLPPDADEAAVSAAMKDGVLTVTVPRRSPEAAAAKARKVAIAKG